MKAETRETKFWSRVEVGRPNDCWNWTGCVTSGYGQVYRAPKFLLAHRYAWEISVGPLSDRLTLHHICRNKVCVNPNHLVPLDWSTHTRIDSHNARKTHCPRGHPYDEANTIHTSPPRPQRVCRTCRNNHHNKRRSNP